MKIIPLSKGQQSLVDDCDYDRLRKHSWYAHPVGKTFYAARKSSVVGMVYMHREIMGFPADDVEHRNLIGTDNQRGNLRLSNQSLNNCNRAKFTRNGKATSQYKGVCSVKMARGRIAWVAHISVGKHPRYIGTFDSEIEAAKAYDAELIAYAGEFALTNFP